MQDINIGSKTIIWTTFGMELLQVVYDLRYMVIASVVLILADMWWGYSASRKRLEDANRRRSATLQDKYKWHKSRAVRRTFNKFVDYLTYLIVGAVLGLAITEPMEICSHVWTAALGLGIGGGCEIASIVGHVVYVKLGVEVSALDAWRAMMRFLGRIIRQRSNEIGSAVEELGRDKDEVRYGEYDHTPRPRFEGDEKEEIWNRDNNG